MSQSMKDSRIQWIGMIPSHWTTIQFRRLFSIHKDIANTDGYDILSVTQQGIKVKDISHNEGQIAQDYSKYQIVAPNDYVMNHMDLLTGYIDISSQRGVTSPDYRVFKALNPSGICLQYFLHIFQLCYKCKIFYTLGQGVSGFGRWRLPAEQLNLFSLPLPPIEEQNIIAEHLNKKCLELDRMISLQEKFIEELRTYKQSTMIEAITKGLDSEAETINSGIEWIGMMPKKWQLTRMKQIGTYINGFAFKPSDWGTKGRKIIRIQDLTGSNTDSNYYDSTIDSKYLVKNGDILISWAATLDAFIWRGEDGWLNQHIFKAIPNNTVITYKYFYHLVKVAMLNMRNANKHGIMMAHVTLGVFNKFIIPIPPLLEQESIANYLDKKCNEIDNLIAIKQRKIEEYKEYKKSLIYEYVTGKKQVI